MASATGIVTVGSSVDIADALWASPGSITADDGVSATTTPNQNLASDGLRGRAADLSAIPDSATITGVFVEIERRQSAASGQVKDQSVRLLVGGALAGDDKASATIWPTTDTIASYGGAADLWGLSLTSAQVKDSQFGVQMQCTRGASGVASTARVDFYRITVYYSIESHEGASTGEGGGGITSSATRIAVATYSP